MDIKKVLEQRKANGILIKAVAHPALVIMAKDVGVDFLFYDCEHGSLAYEKIHDMMVLGNASGIPSIVRVPQLSRADVSKILDYGAQGVMVPMIETREDAEKLAAWSKYPPIGRRSYSGGANTHYAPSGNHERNMQQINERTLTIAQIETVAGVEHADEILSVEGIDAAIIGPCDLGISMGNPDNVMDERELELIAQAAESCRCHKKAFGIIGSMRLIEYFKEDINIMVTGIDTNILRNGMAHIVEEGKKLMER